MFNLGGLLYLEILPPYTVQSSLFTVYKLIPCDQNNSEKLN